MIRNAAGSARRDFKKNSLADAGMTKDEGLGEIDFFYSITF
jgi:hypothetical protein